jgi:hypothetical protein
MNIKRSRWLAFLAVLFVAFPLRPLEVQADKALLVSTPNVQAALKGDSDAKIAYQYPRCKG